MQHPPWNPSISMTSHVEFDGDEACFANVSWLNHVNYITYILMFPSLLQKCSIRPGTLPFQWLPMWSDYSVKRFKVRSMCLDGVWMKRQHSKWISFLCLRFTFLKLNFSKKEMEVSPHDASKFATVCLIPYLKFHSICRCKQI